MEGRVKSHGLGRKGWIDVDGGGKRRGVGVQFIFLVT